MDEFAERTHDQEACHDHQEHGQTQCRCARDDESPAFDLGNRSVFTLQREGQERDGDDLSARFAVPLGEGEHALRAICTWPPADLRPSSPTARLLVDTQTPDCALTEPTSLVVAGDDLDPDQEGVQFEMSGLSEAADAIGQPAVFTVQGGDLDGTAVSEEGVSTATATLLLDPPGAPQELSFRARDAAGNECEDTVTF